MSDPKKPIDDWLDANGKEPMSEELAQFLAKKDTSKEEKEWQQRVHAANYIAHQSDVMLDEEVPDWDRGSMFDIEKRSWWQWQGLPAMSMAFSFFALALVLFKVEFAMTDNGMLVSFGGSEVNHEAKINDLVDQRLREFASEQQVILANYAADIKVKQQETNLDLARYILTSSRQERKEDMSEFMKYINAERQDELLNQKIKFQQLEQKIAEKSMNYNTGKIEATPIGWTEEE